MVKQEDAHISRAGYWWVQVKAALTEGSVPLHKFIITKQLTKQPSEYPDAANQPHVQVALRRRAAGMRSAASQVRD